MTLILSLSLVPQVGALLLLATLAARALAAPAEQPQQQQAAAVTSEQQEQQAAAEAEERVRDKRRLPDPGFVIPATPMGFTKKQQQQQQPSAAPAESAAPAAPAPPRDQRVTASQPRQKKMFYPHGSAAAGRDEHMKALQNFLGQTRKLGVSDEQALKLLDRELNKAKRQQYQPQGGQSPRPVYHATPLKPYGSLINFNSAPYEKHQLKEARPMKPIREQQNDIPPPSKPLVVESDGQLLRSHTEAVVVPSGPLPVSVPMLVQQAQPQGQPQQFPAQQHTAAIALPAGPAPASAAPPQPLVALPLAASHYQALEAHSHSPLHQAAVRCSLFLSHLQHATVIEAHDPSDSPVHVQALHGYAPQVQPQEEHVVHRQPLVVPQPEQHVEVQEVQEVRRPVYVYAPAREEQEEVEVQAPQPHAAGLYREQKEHHEYASQYRFGYRVRDEHAGNDYGHAETREGKMTKGEYFVTLPDGRLQSVKYWADPSGYHAHVSYTNHATHPAPHPHPQQQH
ncbi:Adult-specific cuticular protein ACP-20 [Frankliniella fusca]|uniref:Adult-specific cuticular protein ACP-20 n=1 Tax=Frankliniella fusca TaxID=407009 RepID=A0AAE1HMX7_9NEOP|nr:Adult-specific cuticular protein ACP-20 [Frankliniella fusca]